jgi:hypothetical protein
MDPTVVKFGGQDPFFHPHPGFSFPVLPNMFTRFRCRENVRCHDQTCVDAWSGLQSLAAICKHILPIDKLYSLLIYNRDESFGGHVFQKV